MPTKLLSLTCLILLLAGCSSSLGPSMDVYDRQKISALIDMIEGTDARWEGYATKARAMQAMGHIVIMDLPSKYEARATYWPGGSVPALEWVFLDRAFMASADDYCLLAAAIVHELTHVIHRTGDEDVCKVRAADFDARCLDVWQVLVCGTGQIDPRS